MMTTIGTEVAYTNCILYGFNNDDGDVDNDGEDYGVGRKLTHSVICNSTFRIYYAEPN